MHGSSEPHQYQGDACGKVGNREQYPSSDGPPSDSVVRQHDSGRSDKEERVHKVLPIVVEPNERASGMLLPEPDCLGSEVQTRCICCIYLLEQEGKKLFH